MSPVILASQSRARAQILAGAGVDCVCRPSGVDEEALKAELGGASARDVAAILAEKKALAIARYGVSDGLVIGADQTLEYEGRLFDKAADLAEARARLWLLRGVTHNLHSAVCVAREGVVVFAETVSASLTMRDFSDDFLDGYLQRNPQVLASVGCYELEGEGVQLFSRIDGDFFAILGLPMMGLLECLRREGALIS